MWMTGDEFEMRLFRWEVMITPHCQMSSRMSSCIKMLSDRKTRQVFLDTPKVHFNQLIWEDGVDKKTLLAVLTVSRTISINQFCKQVR